MDKQKGMVREEAGFLLHATICHALHYNVLALVILDRNLIEMDNQRDL